MVGHSSIPVVGTAKKWSTEFRSSFAWLTGRVDAKAHDSAFGAGDGMSAAEAMALAAELEHIVPGDGTIRLLERANAIDFWRGGPSRRASTTGSIMRRYLPEPLATRWNDWFREEIAAREPP